MKETFGGYPFEVKKSGKEITLQFFPKSPSAKNPDLIRFKLVLSKSDLKTLGKIIKNLQ